MAGEREDKAIDQFFFPVGVPLNVEIEGVSIRMKSTSIGYLADSYLIIRYPLASMSISGLLVKGKKITVRYIHGGSVFAFQSEMIFAHEPTKALFISYPLRLAQHSLRSAKRIDCWLPATLSRDAQTPPLGEGVIVDMSVSGCGFTASSDGTLTRLEIGAGVSLQVKLPGTGDLMRLTATVRRIQQDHEKTLLGLHFDEMTEDLKTKFLELISTFERFTWDAS